MCPSQPFRGFVTAGTSPSEVMAGFREWAGGLGSGSFQPIGWSSLLAASDTLNRHEDIRAGRPNSGRVHGNFEPRACDSERPRTIGFVAEGHDMDTRSCQ